MSFRRKQIKKARWLYRHVPIYRGATLAKRDRFRSRWKSGTGEASTDPISVMLERVLRRLERGLI